MDIKTGLSLLKVSNVSLTFGGVNALTDVSLTVNRGEILSIIGPNGPRMRPILRTLPVRDFSIPE